MSTMRLERAALDKFVITGGNRLTGEVTISGAKNAAIAIIPAAILAEGVCRIENIPNITDVTCDHPHSIRYGRASPHGRQVYP